MHLRRTRRRLGTPLWWCVLGASLACALISLGARTALAGDLMRTHPVEAGEHADTIADSPVMKALGFGVQPFSEGRLASDATDDPGLYGVHRHGLWFWAAHQVEPSTTLVMALDFAYSRHDLTGFDPVDALGDAIEGGFSLNLRHAIDPAWRLAINARIASGFASEADSDEAVSFGGMAAITARIVPELGLGIGAVAHTRLEGDALILPLPILDWRIAQRWTVTLGDAAPALALSFHALEPPIPVPDADTGADDEPDSFGDAWADEPDPWDPAVFAPRLRISLRAAFVFRQYRLADGPSPVARGAMWTYGIETGLHVAWRPARIVAIGLLIGVEPWREITLVGDGSDVARIATIGVSAIVRLTITVRWQ